MISFAGWTSLSMISTNLRPNEPVPPVMRTVLSAQSILLRLLRHRIRDPAAEPAGSPDPARLVCRAKEVGAEPSPPVDGIRRAAPGGAAAEKDQRVLPHATEEMGGTLFHPEEQPKPSPAEQPVMDQGTQGLSAQAAPYPDIKLGELPQVAAHPSRAMVEGVAAGGRQQPCLSAVAPRNFLEDYPSTASIRRALLPGRLAGRPQPLSDALGRARRGNDRPQEAHKR